ncbi:DUF2236 domain-containing protein [Williamsia muralis]|uniref:oxygenase MpaB family protein n=1 Tax=Williamsia marianensis TaxID=85044 RepID=UPI003F138438
MTSGTVDGTAALSIDMPQPIRTRNRAETDSAPGDLLDMPGISALAGAANVIMQLALPAVGYGVAESKVDTGNLFKHPIKRGRTTLSYLAVAVNGTPEDRKAYRKAVGHSHAQVRSTESSPVEYNAFDPSLQLWVAACLYKGWEDMQILYGDPSAITEEAYQQGALMGTTLQMPRDMWPATRADFQEYWDGTVAQLEIDDTIRELLISIAKFEFLPKPVSMLIGDFGLFLTAGFLPPEFREKMGLQWTPRQQQLFDLHNRIVRSVVTRLPEPMRAFPFNAYLWDVRRRIRTGRKLI